MTYVLSVRGENHKLNISETPEFAEELRLYIVPCYDSCRYSSITGHPWDQNSEKTPLFVECKHQDFRKLSMECLGQCAYFNRSYGKGKS